MRGEAGSQSVSRATVEEKPAETVRDCGETRRKEGEPEGEEGDENKTKVVNTAGEKRRTNVETVGEISEQKLEEKKDLKEERS